MGLNANRRTKIVFSTQNWLIKAIHKRNVINNNCKISRIKPVRRSFSYPCDPKVRQRIRAKLVARQVSAWSSQVGIYEYKSSQINYNF